MPESIRHGLLPLLKEIQEKNKGLSATDLEKISLKFDLPNNEVFGVSSFYSFLSRKPQGKYVIRICRSLPCHMQEARLIADSVQKILGIVPGEITWDGRFSLEMTDCLGACDQAPAMMVNEAVYGHLTADKIETILKGYS